MRFQNWLCRRVVLLDTESISCGDSWQPNALCGISRQWIILCLTIIIITIIVMNASLLLLHKWLHYDFDYIISITLMSITVLCVTFMLFRLHDYSIMFIVTFTCTYHHIFLLHDFYYMISITWFLWHDVY